MEDASQVEGLSLFSCLAYVVHVSLPHINVLTTQALYTMILVFTVNSGLVNTCELRRVSVVAAFTSCLANPLVDLR